MTNSSHPIREKFYPIAWFVGSIWAVYLLSLMFPSIDQFGIIPRSLSGLPGIVAAPFLHADLGHIVGNTMPLIVLLTILVFSQTHPAQIVISIGVLGGLLLWLFGRPAVHIGASGLIFGLITYLIVSGFLTKRPIPILISLLVGFLYGGSLLGGMIPRLNSAVSWDGHLLSAVAGVLVAYLMNQPPAVQVTPAIEVS